MLGTLPLALGILASPIAVIPAILLLLGDRPRASATAFLVGWTGGLAVVTGAAILLADLIEPGDGPPTWLAWTRIVVGALLLLYGALTWVRRNSQKEPPRWLTGVQHLSPPRAAALGAGLSAANPKVVLLAATAGLTIGTEGGTPGQKLVAFLLFLLIGSIEVLVPLGAYLLAGDRAVAPLERARGWLQDNNTPVVAAVVGIIGAILVLNGIRGL